MVKGMLSYDLLTLQMPSWREDLDFLEKQSCMRCPNFSPY